ncbi:17 kDa surface antigen [Alphaproteobacteria bacterium]
MMYNNVTSGFLKRSVVFLMVPVFLASCETNEAGRLNKANVGVVSGAVLGGIVGSAVGGRGTSGIVGGVAGAALGALAGHAIGAKLDKADLMYQRNSMMDALESNRVGMASAWRNPDSGNSGAITPTRTYVDDYGQNCREYTQRVMVGGKSVEAFGRACRRSDGSWEIIR